MSVSILEVINYAGYDLKLEEDARWLLSQENQLQELLDQSRELIDRIEEEQDIRMEEEYNERFI